MSAPPTTLTEPGTSPAAGAADAPVPGRPVRLDPPGLAGWMSTADHKRVGKLFIGAAFVYLVVGGVLGGLLSAEGVDSGFQVLDDSTFSQVYTLHGEVAVFGFLVPLFLGIATYVVPLQVGATDIAFPRGSVTAFWLHLIGGGLLLGAYLANGGPTGGSETGADLHLMALGLLNVATCVALVSIVATIVSLRAPGMTLRRTPLFSWSLLVGGTLTLLACPVLVARLIVEYVAHHFAAEAIDYGGVRWFWAVPTLYLLVVPAAGVAAEIVPVVVRRPFLRRDPLLIVLAAIGLLGFGAWAQFDDTLLRAGMALAAVLPVFVLASLLGDTVRRGARSAQAALLLALGAVVHLLLGVLAGAVAAIEPLDLEGTTWETGQMHLTLFGAGTLAGFAALWYWAPKIWGVHLGEAAGRTAFALTFFGAVLLAAPDLVNGLVEDLPRGAEAFDSDLVTALNVVRLVGGILAVLGVLVVIADLLRRAGRHTGRPATDDPWGGFTLEWATSSPPPRENFAEPVPPVTSPTPRLEATR